MLGARGGVWCGVVVVVKGVINKDEKKSKYIQIFWESLYNKYALCIVHFDISIYHMYILLCDLHNLRSAASFVSKNGPTMLQKSQIKKVAS